MKKLTVFLIIALMIGMFAACGGNNNSAVTEEPKEKIQTPETQQTFDVSEKEVINIRITLEDGRTMNAELYPKIAPITVQNFVDLCTSGYYDGITFHRVVAGFVIQAGDPTATGLGGSEKTIKGEFTENGFENNLSHDRGVLSMARKSSDMDSASSQFFIVVSSDKKSSLDGKYAAFGKLTSGFNVLASIASVETDPSTDKPLKDVVINNIRVVEGE